ncbi:putative damage-inducible protein DinB [Chitinophaga skermanii]|uniref:Putative damage-inducible protein DinB n=1 Tax=Chitinophaga skermanii TaxID=331697 RepID=A0A327QLI1_9BACT|nr:DinB family protein [Chitinophaga skermanii]RAJ05181.1 putative damage-inducible protein DinB [Chitinophaga skermanii]
MQTLTATTATVSLQDLIDNYVGHRGLTRRIIDAFPEDQLFSFSIGGMRTFGEMAYELTVIGEGIKGLVNEEWPTYLENGKDVYNTKEKILAYFDEVTALIADLGKQLTTERLEEQTNAFGFYPNRVIKSLFYFIDNEIHHRGQGYVYLRALGIEPAPFWDRK